MGRTFFSVIYLNEINSGTTNYDKVNRKTFQFKFLNGGYFSLRRDTGTLTCFWINNRSNRKGTKIQQIFFLLPTSNSNYQVLLLFFPLPKTPRSLWKNTVAFFDSIWTPNVCWPSKTGGKCSAYQAIPSTTIFAAAAETKVLITDFLPLEVLYLARIHHSPIVDSSCKISKSVSNRICRACQLLQQRLINSLP